MSKTNVIDRLVNYDSTGGDWHGVMAEGVPDVETAEQAYKSSGLDWSVEVRPHWIEDKVPVREINDDSTITETIETVRTESRFTRAVITRDPKGKIHELGSVGMQFKPLQNVKLFEAAHPFVENGFATYETAGSLRGRRVVFVGLHIGVDHITDEDAIARRILFTNGHDGSASLQAGFCPWRTYCGNSLHSNLKHGRFLSVRHTESVEENFKFVVETMDIINKRWLVTLEQYRKLTKIVVSTDKFEQYVIKCFIGNLDERVKQFQDELETKSDFSSEQIEDARRRFEASLIPTIRDQANDALENSPGARLKGTYGTLWGCYNAVTYLTTHVLGKNAEQRLYSNMFGGEYSRVGQRALELAVSMI